MDIAQYVLDFVNQTHRSIFLTGKAGTGKTTLLHQIIATTYKNVMVAAPTGIAALNAKGVTLHSLFQLPIATFVPSTAVDMSLAENVNVVTPKTLIQRQQMNSYKRKTLKKLELLIIDEVSMLRADTLDMINTVLKSVRGSSAPFGGVQVLFIGDLLQLPPVVKPQEWELLQQYYKGIFFFHSKVIEENPPLYLELEKVYRQSDTDFVQILNHLRTNEITQRDIQTLQQYIQPSFKPSYNDGYITLTTHNYKADQINAAAFSAIKAPVFTYQAEVKDEFPEYLYPLDTQLSLKVGAQVMFVKNDSETPKRYYNGKIGEVVYLSEEEIRVKLSDEDTVIEVGKYIWEHIRYKSKANSDEIEQEVLGTFTQYPLRLAWAITVHKSQGLTFDKAVIDLADAFASGQTYVALSRLRSLDGLILLSSLNVKEFFTATDVKDYASQKAAPETLADTFSSERKAFLEKEVLKTFSWLDLAVQWGAHVSSYKQENARSLKSQFRQWAQEQSRTYDTIVQHSEKFLNQLRSIFSDPHYDKYYLYERFQKAYDYFYPQLDRLALETFYTHLQVNGKKQVKAFTEELTQLEDMQIDAIVQLLKTKIILESIIDPPSEQEERKSFEKAKNYRERLLGRAIEKWREDSLNGKLSTEAPELVKKKEKKEKISTYALTLELWKQKKNVAEIAAERKLTESTVYGHLTKYIGEGAISIEEVLSAEKLQHFQQALPTITQEETLNELRARVGEEYSFGEIKLFRAYWFYKNRDKEG
ncbi:helix-turn-helix domain-containing protein [Capnocytophaga granulosa]